MSEPRRRRVDVMLAPDYLDGLGDVTLEQLRAMHEECLEVETEVSYVRRLAQARIDIVRAELDRRATGGSVGDLVTALPRILADEVPRAHPEHSRLPRHLAPAPGIQWKRGLEHLIVDATLVNLPTMSDRVLEQTLEQLADLERETSERRSRLHAVVDAVEAELATRHVARA